MIQTLVGIYQCYVSQYHEAIKVYEHKISITSIAEKVKQKKCKDKEIMILSVCKTKSFTHKV